MQLAYLISSSTVGFWVNSNWLCRHAVAHMNLPTWSLDGRTALYMNHQNHFLISGVFIPPGLWYAICRFFGGMKIFMTDWNLYILLRFNYAGSWSNLIKRQFKVAWLSAGKLLAVQISQWVPSLNNKIPLICSYIAH